MENRIALLGIIIEDMGKSATVNDLLHDYSRHIIGRLGLP